VSDEIAAIFIFLQTCKSHLGAGDVLFRVLQVFKEGFFTPCYAFLDVSLSVRETFCLSRVASKNTMEIGSHFVSLARAESMTLCASSFKE